MGFDLGLMAAAYHGAKKAERQARDDEYEAAVRDYDLANRKEAADTREGRLAAENARLKDAVQVYAQREQLRPRQTEVAGLGLEDQAAQLEAARQVRPAQTAASITGYNLQKATGDANLALVPGDLQNKQIAQGIQNNELQFTQGQQPVVQKAKAINNTAGITQANTGLVKAGIDYSLTSAEAKMAPDKIVQAYIGNKMSTDQAMSAALGGFAQRLHANDTAGAVNYVNQIIAQTDLFPGAKGKKVANVEQVQGENGSWVARLTDAKGQLVADVPKERLQQAYLSTIGKGEIKDVAPGHKLATVRNGVATEVFENPKDPLTSEHMPAEAKMFNFLTGRTPGNGPRTPMTDEQALAWIKTAKEKSETEFVATAAAMDLNYSMANEAEKAKIRESWRQLYRSAKSGESLGLSNASNSSVAGTINPVIKDMVNGK